jgi:S-adenosyl-L-methionine hydrolase (adenosine-forming)
MSRPICFASDYGYADDFAGVCRGVIARIAPDVRVIDVTHGLPQRDVMAGALILRNSLPYMPDQAVHLTVVDPGVGGPRRALALRTHGDRFFVGPDNGLMMLAVARDGGAAEACELTNEELWLSPLSATFHGRDIFAPVAARLAGGLPLSTVGTAVEPGSLTALELPEPRRHRDGLTATALLVDRFGNITLNLRARQLEDAHLGDQVELLCGSERFLARVARTFASVRPSDIVVLVDSYGQAAIAVNAGSAVEVLGLEPGDQVRLRRLG